MASSCRPNSAWSRRRSSSAGRGGGRGGGPGRAGAFARLRHGNLGDPLPAEIGGSGDHAGLMRNRMSVLERLIHDPTPCVSRSVAARPDRPERLAGAAAAEGPPFHHSDDGAALSRSIVAIGRGALTEHTCSLVKKARSGDARAQSPDLRCGRHPVGHGPGPSGGLAAFLEPHGITVTDEVYLARISGRTNAAIFADLFPGRDSAELDRFAEEKEALFRRMAPGLPPLAGLLDLLAWAQERALKLAVVTNGPRINLEHAMEGLAVRDFFEVLLAREDVTHGKPDPMPYLTALDRLGTEASEAIVFEDSPSNPLGQRRRHLHVRPAHGPARLHPARGRRGCNDRGFPRSGPLGEAGRGQEAGRG